MAAGDNRGHGGNSGYDDQIDAYYSWDSKVPNHTKLQVGDPIAVWDKERLLGVSVIEEIDVKVGQKLLKRCPFCTKTNISERKTVEPRFRCTKCRHEFNEPVLDLQEVHLYTARYDAAWTDLEGLLTKQDLQRVFTFPGDINAMRPIKWEALQRSLLAKQAALAVERVVARADLQPPREGVAVEFAHGFTERFVRVRRGQGRFRQAMLTQQGEACAFTGGAPARVLEAGHLYSYAQLGIHHEHGGLMLRRDIHRLFDDGLLTVDPSRLRIDVAGDLARYSQYASLHDQPLRLRLNDQQVQWLDQHWSEHRAS